MSLLCSCDDCRAVINAPCLLILFYWFLCRLLIGWLTDRLTYSGVYWLSDWLVCHSGVWERLDGTPKSFRVTKTLDEGEYTFIRCDDPLPEHVGKISFRWMYKIDSNHTLSQNERIFVDSEGDDMFSLRVVFLKCPCCSFASYCFCFDCTLARARVCVCVRERERETCVCDECVYVCLFLCVCAWRVCVMSPGLYVMSQPQNKEILQIELGSGTHMPEVIC